MMHSLGLGSHSELRALRLDAAMRILLCQTPKLTYVQVIELLNNEMSNGHVDLVVFPELAMEHPPQLTEHGVLTTDNVGFLMLSRWAKQRKTYVVVGSVDERTPDGHHYETCVVFDKDGEIVLRYRKQSIGTPTKDCGVCPGSFLTEFGKVGLLLGAEVEEELRWTPLLYQKPCLILNPSRAPPTTDPALVRAHPELEIVAWHRSFAAAEHNVEARMRTYTCSFARVDAPISDGGGGSSCLVEPHRSTLCSSWGTM